jgi:hypothetical protein
MTAVIMARRSAVYASTSEIQGKKVKFLLRIQVARCVVGVVPDVSEKHSVFFFARFSYL